MRKQDFYKPINVDIHKIKDKDLDKLELKGATMKELKALKEIKQEHEGDCNELGKHFSVFNKVRYKTVEKGLKALEFIYGTGQITITKTTDGKHFFMFIGGRSFDLKENVYNLLKEVFKDE